jgi:exosortase
LIELAQMKLQVVEACSGIRSLVSLFTLAVVYLYFSDGRWWKRVAILLAVVPLAIFANAVRVAGTGVMAHHYGIRAAEGFLHGFSGWLVFLAAIVLLAGFAALLDRMEGLFA